MKDGFWVKNQEIREYYAYIWAFKNLDEHMSDETPKHFTLFGLVFPFKQKLFIKLLIRVWLVGALLLLVSMLFFGYEMTNADIPCGLIAGVLLAYLISLWMD